MVSLYIYIYIIQISTYIIFYMRICVYVFIL